MNVVVLAALVLLSQASATEPSKTVIGPRNAYIADGADALTAGNGEEGVRLTLQGLATANSVYETKIAHANLCAGYLLLEELQTALEHCNWVLERDDLHWRTYNNRALVYLGLKRFEEAEADIRKGQELRPNAKTLKIVKGMYLDETLPVKPRIEIDERRNPRPVAEPASGNENVD